MKSGEQKPFMIIGTSGSTDYLRDTAGDRRFWPVRVEASRDEEVCDGLHDEEAPAHHLCSRCFPNGFDLRGDLAKDEEDDYDKHVRDEERKID